MRKLLLLFAVLATANSVLAENYILYTSSDGQIVNPSLNGFDANIVSNTYEDGQGKILFDGEVTIIGEEAFYRCYGLTSVVIPNSVTRIGSQAFYHCDGLTSVVIGNSVTEIGSAPFKYCWSLESISGKFATEDHRCLIVDGELNSVAHAGLTSYSIPNSVTGIGGCAFEGCKSLTSVVILSSVTTILKNVFCGCTSVASQ